MLPESTDQWGLELGRVRDHTTNLQTGTYLAISERRQNRSRIASPPVFYQHGSRSPNGGEDLPCMMRFHFFIDIKHMANLAVYTRQFTDGPLTGVWYHDGSTGWWERVELVVMAPPDQPIQFIIEANSDTTNNINDIVAIDDLSFSGSCSFSEGPLPPYNETTTPAPNPCREDEFRCLSDQCIMASSVCDFKPDCHDDSDEFECAECRFTPEPHVGTCGWEDHSLGHWGWQLQDVFEGQWGMAVVAREGEVSDKADVQTGALGQTAATCEVTFSYMKDADADTLIRMRLYNANDTKGSVIWKKKNALGQRWNTEHVSIGARDRNWRLAMEAVKAADVNGTIAFSSMHFTNCSLPPAEECGEGEAQCRNGVCVPQDQWCDFSNDCGDWSDEAKCVYAGGCNFETDICEFTQDTTADFNWQRRTGDSDQEGVAPGEDHTYGNSTGYYMYIEPSMEPADSTATLLGPTFQASSEQDQCNFRMWYHMDGGDITQLAVYTREEGGSDTLMWKTEMEQEYSWLETILPLITTSSWRVVITATRSMGPKGDVAIDDLTFSTGCQLEGNSTTAGPTITPTTASGCGEQQFQCGDLTCIPREQICDFKAQCVDESDESGCKQLCTFDATSNGDLCFWKERHPDSLDWVLARPNNSADGTNIHGPYGDTSDGYFVFLHASAGTADFSNTEATLESPTWQHSKASCTLQFWLYLTGNIGKQLEVVLEDKLALEDTSLAYLSDAAVSAEVWNFMQISLGSHRGTFQVSPRNILPQIYQIISPGQFHKGACGHIQRWPCSQ